MGNTLSWRDSDLIDNMDFLLHVKEPMVFLPDEDEVSVEYYRTNPTNKTDYKFYMCKHMKQKGVCRYGSACKFAHSRTELWIPTKQFIKRKNFTLRLVD